ncbi:MAG: FAD-dependent oxidoreductase, partial [Chloroflexota bacterium]
MANKTDSLIIGGGVIGVCAAFFLAERGGRVTLVEQGEIAAGSSYGNAGLIVPSHITPLPTPGALTSGLKWMLDPESPFYIKPRLDLDLISWVLKFGAAANERQMQKAIPTIREMGRASSALHVQLAALDLDCGYKQDGLLSLFITPHGMDDGLAEEKLLRANGVNADRVRTEFFSAAEVLARVAARGLPSVDAYYAGNELGREVTIADVAKAFYDLSTSMATTGCVLSVDGGNFSSVLR